MRRERQSGFALLLVFLMAAAIAISLYLQIPRVAFQAQRQKEQLLIERGEQYKRAIQLFYKANNRYPAEIKDLESFNNRRFLRHRFLDPMTGKDDWRLVHINNGVLTDSILTKKKSTDANQPASTAGQYVGEQAGIGQTLASTQPTQNIAVARRRPSEGGAPLPAIGPDGQPLPPGQYPVDPTQPAAGQPYPGAAPGQPMAPGQGFVPGQPYPAGQPQPYPGGVPPVPGAPGQMYPGVQAQPYPGAPTQPYPGAQPYPGGPVSPDGQPLAGNLANGQPTVGTPLPPEVANPPGTGNFPGQQAPFRGIPGPGQIPGMNPAGGQPNPASQSYVGGSQPYVGSSQPYVGGGAYIGSQPAATPTSVTPPPYTPGVNPAPFPPPSSGPFNPGGLSAPVQQPSNPVMNAGQPGFPTTPAGPAGLGAAGVPQPGPGAGNPGANFINNILTTPRPGPAGAQPQGQQIGGGIAGVASKAESPSIMVYNDRTKYDEWEFIFDPTKQAPVPNPNASTIGTPAQSLGSSPGAPGFGTSPTAPGFGMGRGGPGLGTPGAAGAFGAGAPVTAGSPNPGQPGAITGQTSQLPPNIRPGRP